MPTFPNTLTKDGYDYLIGSAADLCDLSEYVNAGNDCAGVTFKLAADIDLSDVRFKPIGDGNHHGQGTFFNGTFDGDGHIIRNLIINAMKDYQGLFGCNLGTIENCTVSSSISGKKYVGGLIGINYGTIKNCKANGSVSGTEYVGGLAGSNHGTIENSKASGSVSGTEYVGGFAGKAHGGTVIIKNCATSGAVSGQKYVGGFIGSNYAIIENCKTSGSVSGVKYVGGLAGENGGTITNCKASGLVSGAEYIDKFIGCKYKESVSDCSCAVMLKKT